MKSDKTIWQYTFQNTRETREGWAYVILRSDGFFAAVSDYGNYAYLWSSHGKRDFREFFLRMDWHYIATKLKHGPDLVDPEDSFQAIKKFVCEMRHEHRYSKEEARERWQHIQRFASDEVWEAFLYDSETHRLFEEPWHFTKTRMRADVVAFAKQVVCTRLRDAIRAELEAEKGTAVAVNV
jgi:hypothetical protein